MALDSNTNRLILIGTQYEQEQDRRRIQWSQAHSQSWL